MTATSTRASQDSLVPPRVGRVLLVVCWLAVAYGTAAVVPRLSTLRGAGAWIATVVFLLTFTAAIERPELLRLLPLSALAGVAMEFCAPSNGAFVAVIAVIAVAGIRLDTDLSRRVAALSSLGFLAAGSFATVPISPGQAVAVVLAFLFTYLGSAATRRLRTEQRRTAELLEEVVAGRDAIVRAAALDERAHLAREMHDVLAHTLSALSIQLEGTRMLAEQRGCDPDIVAAIERVSGLSREGLGEARRAVGSLHGETLPGPDLLPDLAREYEQDTGVPCRLEVEGDPVDLPADARLALYRIAQEALTNVRKHSDASYVTITLRNEAGGVELVVENEGTPRASPLPGGGHGVSGMRERAELLHGTLEAARTARGFRVQLWIPTTSRPQSVS